MNKKKYNLNMVTPHELELNHWQGHGEFPRFHVSCSLGLNSDQIDISFKVEKPKSEDWQNQNTHSSSYYKNWGLWETDVVEFFLQGRNEAGQIHLPYIEFLVSPDNSKFALMTLIPRKVQFTPQDLKFISHSKINGDHWSCQLSIQNPFEHSDMLWGNFHACLGQKDKRQYYSAFHQSHPCPDFHRPEQFELLGEKNK